MSDTPRSSRNYHKESLSLEGKDVPTASYSSYEKEVKNPQSIKYDDRYYTKPLDGDRDYYLIILITEDAKRTLQYFRRITDKNIRGFHLLTISKKGQGIPASHMMEKANDCMTTYGLNFNSGDELYLLCDLDHYRRQLVNLIKTKSKPYKIIISNPCIEIWFYYGELHERPDNLPNAFQCPIEEEKIPQEFKKFCNNQINGGVKPLTAILNIETAIVNSKRHYAVDGDQIPVLYATNMFVLAERLLELFKPELDELRRCKQESREKYVTKKTT